jgi:pimeloyl-ACP methyl ester carboxylesterase
MKVSPALLDTARDTPLKAIDMVNAFSIGTLAAKPSFPGPGMWLHGSNRALMRRVLAGPNAEGPTSGCAVNLFHHDFSVCDAYADGLRSAARVTAPVTMILGEMDQMTPPRATRDIAAALKARIVTLPSGHHLLAEVPDGVLAALRQALA